MKIENVDNIVIVYLFNENIDIDDIDDLNKKIKNVFVKIMKRGNYNFFGYSKVSVYHNKNYGLILEVEKLSQSETNYRTIDLKIVVYKNIPFYIEFDDYFDFNRKEIKVINDKYYIEIDEHVDIHKYIEFGRIKYKKMLNKID